MLKLFNSGRNSTVKAVRALRAFGDIGRIPVNGLDIEFWRHRRGPRTIVFLHGNSAGKEVFHRQFDAFASKDYSLLAIDLPGHGGSADSKSPETDYNFPALALIIKRLLAELEIHSPLLVGWSLGGHVVIEMAGRGFDLAGAMIFGTPPIGPGLSDFEKAFLPSEAMSVTLKEAPTPEELKKYVKGLYGSLAEPPDAFTRLAERMDGAVRSHMGAHWAKGEEGCHQKTVVAGWEKPLCVLHGEADAFVSGDYLGELAWRNLWSGEIICLPKIGHAPFIEAPDRFNEILSGFAAAVFAQDAT